MYFLILKSKISLQLPSFSLCFSSIQVCIFTDGSKVSPAAKIVLDFSSDTQIAVVIKGVTTQLKNSFKSNCQYFPEFEPKIINTSI